MNSKQHDIIFSITSHLPHLIAYNLVKTATDFEKKNPDGFIHSTGHGLGLEIHEPPRVSSLKEILKANQVITIEPGLYYSNIGGVRIEDTVVVTKEGCKSLSKFPKFFEI